jgi:DNA-binding transcriptional LysR family regulator
LPPCGLAEKPWKERAERPVSFCYPAARGCTLAGLGLAYMVEDVAQPYIDGGTLVRVLEDWCLPFSGYHLYYPSRRQSSSAFNVLVDALRYKD